MSRHIESRKVARVLVIVEYQEGEQGDVFDVTALAHEMANRPTSRHHHCRIELGVTCSEDYDAQRIDGKPRPTQSEISWNVMADFSSSGRAGFLDDAVNASMPDSFATQELRKKLEKANKAAEKLAEKIQTQRLMDAAAVRAQRPIARVTIAPKQILSENPA